MAHWELEDTPTYTWHLHPLDGTSCRSHCGTPPPLPQYILNDHNSLNEHQLFEEDLKVETETWTPECLLRLESER